MLFEVERGRQRHLVRKSIPDANIIFGAAFDPALEGKIRVSVVATGMDAGVQAAIPPSTIKTSAAHASVMAARQAPAPVAEPIAARTVVREPAPSWPEPARAGSVSASVAATPAPTLDLPLEPVIVAPAQAERAAATLETEFSPSRRIVDVSAAEDGDEADLAFDPLPPRLNVANPPKSYSRPGQGPLPDPRLAPEPRRGLLSLFGGRPRYDAPPAAPMPAPRAATGQGASAAPKIEPLDAAEDLEIPSFLRRLAN